MKGSTPRKKNSLLNILSQYNQMFQWIFPVCHVMKPLKVAHNWRVEEKDTSYTLFIYFQKGEKNV